MSETTSSPQIGTLNEGPLHAALKAWYARPGDRLEVPVHGFVVDIVRGDLLVEVQTGSFAHIKDKLADLAASHRVRLVYPIPQDKWIVKLPKNGQGDERRRMSPKHGAFEDVFEELVSVPTLLADPGFSVEVVLTREEEVWRYVGKRAWRRRGWTVEGRRLVDVVDRREFGCPADAASLVPGDLAQPFTTGDLADALGRRRRLAQKMAYCLRKMGVLDPVGKRGNAILYVRAAA